MKKVIAVPADNGNICMHFGHCAYFDMFHVEDDKIVNNEKLDAPPHQPGLLPQWLKERGATDIIACGMGQRAISLFESNNIHVVVGVAPNISTEDLVLSYLQGELTGGGNYCDH